ncbi:MAG: hypothetical protein QF415_05195 [Candidatus Undinarchaeales archaeon]|jgi:hypothetical protein|nr:hypothetical protein [Candidatus Undinarchaeales archaeon]MDP7494165.1 hypothetical protein [Candidatus Undinarchaeales archaeon]
MREHGRIGKDAFDLLSGKVSVTNNPKDDMSGWIWNIISYRGRTAYVEERYGDITLWFPSDKLPDKLLWSEEEVRYFRGWREEPATCHEGSGEGQHVLRIAFQGKKSLYYRGVQLFEDGPNYVTADQRAEEVVTYPIEVTPRETPLLDTRGAAVVLSLLVLAVAIEVRTGTGAPGGWLGWLVSAYYVVAFLAMGWVLQASVPSVYDPPAEMLTLSFILFIVYRGIWNILALIGLLIPVTVHDNGLTIIAVCILASWLLYKYARKQFYVLADGGALGAVVVVLLTAVLIPLTAESTSKWGAVQDRVSMIAPMLIALGAYYAQLDYIMAPTNLMQFAHLRDTIIVNMAKAIKEDDRAALEQAGADLDDLTDGLRIAMDPELMAYHGYMDNLCLLEDIVQRTAEHYYKLEPKFEDPRQLKRELIVMAKDLKTVLESGQSVRVSPKLRAMLAHIEKED